MRTLWMALRAASLATGLVLGTTEIVDASTHYHYSYRYSYHYRPHTYHFHASHYYTNVSGHRVYRPVFATHAPRGWSAQCADGSYSFSEHHRGTCSHHGGVSQWH